MKYSVKVGETSLTLTEQDIAAADLLQVATDQYHVLQDHKAYTCQVLSVEGKQIRLAVNGAEHTVTIADEYDQLIDSMGLSVVASQKLSSVKAPMPGLVLDVMVEPGQEVAEGDSLLILEAMKMENVLKATGEGVVKSIEITKGAAVEKGQILIEME